MKRLFLIIGLFAALPAFAQTKVYTNADLGQPLSPNRGSVSPAVLASLVANQFRTPVVGTGPTVVSSGLSPTTGPFSDYRNTIVPRRLDGSLYSDPPWQAIHGPVFYPYVPNGPYAPSLRGPRTHGGRSGRSGHRGR